MDRGRQLHSDSEPRNKRAGRHSVASVPLGSLDDLRVGKDLQLQSHLSFNSSLCPGFDQQAADSLLTSSYRCSRENGSAASPSGPWIREYQLQLSLALIGGRRPNRDAKLRNHAVAFAARLHPSQKGDFSSIQCTKWSCRVPKASITVCSLGQW